MKIQFDGTVPIVPIPFRPDETINEADLRRLVEFVALSGVSGMCLPAYGSEFYKLSEAERESVIDIAIQANRKRVPLIAQANHGASRIAAVLAKHYEEMGADMISVAIPRQFTVRDTDVLRYLGKIANAISAPMLVQDFNPGGPTMSADFIDTLNRVHPNVQYVKLEEPLMVAKLLAIRERVGDRVGVLEGWGGYYMLELIPHGICGIMPGVAILEPLERVYRLRKKGDLGEALYWMGNTLPFINYTLQNMELFMHVEKRLLVKRGLLEFSTVRDCTFMPIEEESQYIDRLCDHMLEVIGKISPSNKLESPK